MAQARSLRLKHSTHDRILINQLLKFRIDGRTINARNVDEIYPGLDRLLMKSLQTGDCRQLYNRLKRNLKAEYLLITGKHIHCSVASQTEHILEKLVEMGATLNLHFYEPIHMKELQLMCQYGFDLNERINKYNNQTPLSIFINKHYSITMLETLIKNGAHFDSQDNQGQTCIHHVCQPSVTDPIFDYIIEQAPDPCLSISNQAGATPVDLVFLSTYEQANTSRMRRLHVLLSRKSSYLTRYAMREPNLFRKQHLLYDVISCKEFLFKYRLNDIFDPSISSLAKCIFLFYDVLRACNKYQTSFTEQIQSQQRLERYLISMIENDDIRLDEYIFRQSNTNEQILTDLQKSLLNMTQIKLKLLDLRTKTLTLKSICRKQIKQKIRNYPNDIVKLNTISKILQAYLTFYNPFIKVDVAENII